MNNSGIELANGKSLNKIQDVMIWRVILNREDRIGMDFAYFTAQRPEDGLPVIRQSLAAHNRQFFGTVWRGVWSLNDNVERVYYGDVLLVGNMFYFNTQGQPNKVWRVEHERGDSKDVAILIAHSLEEALEAVRLVTANNVLKGESFFNTIVPVDSIHDRKPEDNSLILINGKALGEKIVSAK